MPEMESQQGERMISTPVCARKMAHPALTRAFRCESTMKVEVALVITQYQELLLRKPFTLLSERSLGVPREQRPQPIGWSQTTFGAMCAQSCYCRNCVCPATTAM